MPPDNGPATSVNYGNGLSIEAKEYTMAGNLMATCRVQLTQGRLIGQSEMHVLPTARDSCQRFSDDASGNSVLFGSDGRVVGKNVSGAGGTYTG